MLLTTTAPVILAAGPLTLDTGARRLSGPKGTLAMDRGPFVVLRELMARPWQLVTHEHLFATCWPDPDAEPDDAAVALRLRVGRVRDAMQRVGVEGARLVTRVGAGFLLEGEPREYRALTAAQAAAVDVLALTHPAWQPGAAA